MTTIAKDATADPVAVENHRVRVAREKRTRMRAALLHSVIAVCSGADSSSPAVIDDVVRHAGVSRGTFYKYFVSLEQAIAEVALQLANEMSDVIKEIYADITDPPLRIAIAAELFLTRARFDPAWGRFVTHLGLLNANEHGISSSVRDDLRMGCDSCDYHLRSIDAAADMLVGTLIEAVNRIVSGDTKHSYIDQIAEMMLLALGVDPKRAEYCVLKAKETLRSLAPEWSTGELCPNLRDDGLRRAAYRGG